MQKELCLNAATESERLVKPDGRIPSIVSLAPSENGDYILYGVRLIPGLAQSGIVSLGTERQSCDSLLLSLETISLLKSVVAPDPTRGK